MNLSALSIRYPRVTLVAVLTVVVWGLVALATMPRREDPEITWRLANVVTFLPGTSATRVEALITDVLERHVEQVDEVEHIYSVSRPGLSLLQIELSDDVTQADPVWQKVRHKLTQAANELPPGVVGPDLDDEIMGTSTLLLGVASQSASYRQLKDYAQSLEDDLRYLPETASTTLYGTQQEVIHVEVDPTKLAVYDLTFHQIAAALRHRNTRDPSGRLRVSGYELVIEASGEFRREDELARMVLLVTPQGRTLHMGDVATIRRTTVEPPEPLARINGVSAVVVGVRARASVRIDTYGTQVKAIADRFRRQLPEGIECTVVHDESRYTAQQMNQLALTLLVSVVFVFLSATVFMGWRAGTVVTASIPFTGLLVLVLLSVLGVPLQQMSVMGIIMAFGLLVDDAVVVTEHIQRRAASHASLLAAAVEGPAELFAPLTVTTLTTIAAFIPIYLLPGGTGEFVRAIPITVSLCLLMALLVAATIVPFLCIHLFRAHHSSDDAVAVGPVPGWFDRLLDWYEGFLRGVVAKPLTWVTIVVVLMGLLGSLGLTLRRDFFSPVQRDTFVVDIFGPQGSSLARTTETVKQIESILAQDDLVVTTSAYVGRNAPLVFYNLTSQETYADQFAQLIVRVQDWRSTAKVAERVQSLLDAQVADADCCVHILEHGAPFIAPFEVRISGPSIETLRELGQRAANILTHTRGVRNVRQNYGSQALRLITQVHEPIARQLGIDQQTVADELRYRFDGLAAGTILEDDEQIDIVVRLPRSDRERIAQLNSVYFKPSPEAEMVPLAAVATVIPKSENASIYRRDGRRTLSVLGYPRFGLTPAQVSKRFAPQIDALSATLPPSYSLELGGENEQRHEAESALLKRAIYAAMLIIVLLVIEFRSFRATGLILAAVPLSTGGAMLGLWLTGWPLNFMAIMGMMMLAGVVINDVVILVDGYQRRQGQGQETRESVVAGTLDRTRHVVITTVTTVAGFLPLALSPSLLWPPLAMAIIGGLIVATLLTLVAVPAAYVMICRK